MSKPKREDSLHAFALRTLRAQSWDNLNRLNENSKIVKEAKLEGIAPNEILQYVLKNKEQLQEQLAKQTA